MWYGFAQTLLSFGHFPYQGNNIVPYELPTNLYGYIVGADALHPPVIYELSINLYGKITQLLQV